MRNRLFVSNELHKHFGSGIVLKYNTLLAMHLFAMYNTLIYFMFLYSMFYCFTFIYKLPETIVHSECLLSLVFPYELLAVFAIANLTPGPDTDIVSTSSHFTLHALVW